MIEFSINGFGMVYGIGALGASIALGVGGVGLAPFFAAFGIVSGVGSFGSGAMRTIGQISSYPFCYGSEEERNSVVLSIDEAVSRLSAQFNNNGTANCTTTEND